MNPIVKPALASLIVLLLVPLAALHAAETQPNIIMYSAFHDNLDTRFHS